MTFNIRCNTVFDGPNRWPHRRELAAHVIRRYGADFVGVQEAEPDQIADLVKLLPEYRLLGRSREADPKVGEASPIFYRHKRWRLDADRQGTFWLSDTPEKPGSKTWGNGYPRIVTWGRFVEEKTGHGAYAFNTHFDHLSEASRRKSATLLARRIAERSRPEPVVLTGDFNSGESSAALAYLTGKKPGSPIMLIDTFRAVAPGREAGGHVSWLPRRHEGRENRLYPGIARHESRFGRHSPREPRRPIPFGPLPRHGGNHLSPTRSKP